MGSEFKQVPVEQAGLVGEIYNMDQVIILSLQRENNKAVVTTWGKTAVDADQAAQAGNEVKRYLGWPEVKCTSISARVIDIRNDLREAKTLIISNLSAFEPGGKVDQLLAVLDRAMARIDGKAGSND